MWKKAFVALLSLNLLIVVGFTLWWGSLPKANQVQTQVDRVAGQNQTATIDLTVGEDAINTYLEYALTEQQDLQKVLSYARVQFNDKWDVQVGIRLRDRVIPSDIVFNPTIQGGNLSLQVDSANMGQVYVPPDALFFILKKLPWPAWIGVDSANQSLNINFTERPQHPYGIQILNYSPASKQLTARVTILPKSLLPQ